MPAKITPGSVPAVPVEKAEEIMRRLDQICKEEPGAGYVCILLRNGNPVNHYNILSNVGGGDTAWVLRDVANSLDRAGGMS